MNAIQMSFRFVIAGHKSIHSKALSIIAAYSTALFIMVTMGIGCASIDPVTKKNVHNNYTIEEDIELGQSCLEHNVAEMRKKDINVNIDQKMTANLEKIVRRIASVSELPDLPYTVTLFQSDVVNASAAPGGALMVYSGLYDQENGMVRNNDELAAVVAHEIAHVTCRHGTEQMSKSETVSTVGQVLSVGLSVAASIATGDANVGRAAGDVFDVAFSLGAGLWFPSYNRSQESEADAVSLTYLAKARIDPRAAVAIWKRVAAQSKGEKATLYDSHPTGDNRFKNLEKIMPAVLKLYEEAGGKIRQAELVSPF